MSQISYPSKFLSWHVYVEGLMVESITRFEWIRRSVFDVGGSNTGSEGIGKHLKRRKGEDIETENICNVEEPQ